MVINMISVQDDLVISNLSAAYEVEAKAEAMYQSFASRAEADALHGIASLFRVAAYSKGIAALNHSDVIRDLGGEVNRRFVPFQVKSTLKNLYDARLGELSSVDQMYPVFLSEAESAEPSVIRALTWAWESGKTLAGLLHEAVRLVEAEDENSWIARPRSFYVRSVCGSISKSPSPTHCWVCERVCGGFDVIR